MSLHESQKLFGLQLFFLDTLFSQLRAFAINLAVVVFPTPLIPVNK